MPKPVSASQPLRAYVPRRVAHDVLELGDRGPRSGLTVQTQAAAPATRGAEKPCRRSSRNRRVAPRRSGTATGIETPGAARSSALERLERNAEAVALVGRSHREDVRQARRDEAAVARTAGRCRPRPPRSRPGAGPGRLLSEQRIEPEEAAADVDHAPPALGRCVEPGKNLDSDPSPKSHSWSGRLGVHADQADSVRRRCRRRSSQPFRGCPPRETTV